MPDDVDAAPGTTEGAAPHEERDDDREIAGAREQGVWTERSDDLSSPRFTVPAEDGPGDRGAADQA